MANRAQRLAQNKNKKTKNPFRVTSGFSSSIRTSRIPLKFKRLKANTKYKIFLQNNEGTSQEDITNFCVPYGVSIENNNNTAQFNEFVSTSGGELYLYARPYGVDNVDLDGSNWANHWRFARQGTKFGDVGRENFIIVESSRVSDATGPGKLKTINKAVKPTSRQTETVGAEIEKYVRQSFSPEFVQTFFVDPNLLGDASSIDITDIGLFFRNKPDKTENKSGKDAPGATICLVDVVDGVPVIEKQYKDSIRSVSWDFITKSTDASVETVFEFKTPIRLYPGRTYGICVSFDDEDFILWSCEKGDILVGTDVDSTGPSKDHRGVLFTKTNAQEKLTNKNFDSIFTEKGATDLKFNIRAAQYDLSAVEEFEIDLVNMNQEFIIVENTNDNWVGAEYVYDDSKSFIIGTVNIQAANTTITGANTSFTGGTITKDARIIVDDGIRVQLLDVAQIVDSTTLIVKQRPLFDMTAAQIKITPVAMIDHYDFNSKLLYLRNSSANSSVYFEANNVIKGIESGEVGTISKIGALPLSVFTTDLDVNIPSTFQMTAHYQFSEKDGDDYKINTVQKPVDFFSPNYITDYNALIVSRSLEAQNASLMFDEDVAPGQAPNNLVIGSKSVKFALTFDYDGIESKSFESPSIDLSRFNLITKHFTINNDTTNEHTNDGEALSKHISKRLVLDEGKVAEDIRIIQNAYKPRSTDIKVYAKILNNDDDQVFDEKSWTELELVTGQNEFSSSENPIDYREYEYAFPRTIPSDTTLDGTVITQSGNAVITGQGTTFTDLDEGDVIKLYSPLFENNYGYFSIVNVENDEEMTLHEAITNTNIVGTGFKIDTVKTPQTAYLNPLNLNVVRYFGPQGDVFDGYSTVAIKTVLLSDDELLIPTVDDYRVISVSA